jgi:hypothetical protein
LIVHPRRFNVPNARQKLNGAAVNGAVMLGVLAGWLTGSWIVFFVTTLFVLAGSMQQGTIRPHSRRR